MAHVDALRDDPLAPAAAGVDATVLRPTGFPNPGWERWAVAVGPELEPLAWDHAVARLSTIVEPLGLRWSQVALLGGPDPDAVADDGIEVAGRAVFLRSHRGVLDHPGAHRSMAEHATSLVRLAAAGAPLVAVDLPPTVAALLGPALRAVLTSRPPAQVAADLADRTLRERWSVLLRRAALRDHGSAWRRPVSCVLATRRPDFLDLALSQYARQDVDDRELVVALHGNDFPADVRDRIARTADACGTPWQVVEVAAELELGDAINAGIEAASGDVVTKIDDDDWYGDSHLADVLLALHYSGAELVGKGAEFVLLARADLPGADAHGVTVRRWMGHAEAESTTLAGGTLTMLRDTWRSVGGFASVGLGEDQQLVADIRAAGGTTYRTHGFGYLLHRHGDHAWNVDPSMFLDQADETRPGRDHDWSLT